MGGAGARGSSARLGGSRDRVGGSHLFQRQPLPFLRQHLLPRPAAPLPHPAPVVPRPRVEAGALVLSVARAPLERLGERRAIPAILDRHRICLRAIPAQSPPLPQSGAPSPRGASVRGSRQARAGRRFFGHKCAEAGIGRGAIIAGAAGQQPFDPHEPLRLIEERMGVTLTIFFSWKEFVRSALFWIEIPDPTLPGKAAEAIYRRLKAIEASWAMPPSKPPPFTPTRSAPRSRASPPGCGREPWRVALPNENDPERRVELAEQGQQDLGAGARRPPRPALG